MHKKYLSALSLIVGMVQASSVDSLELSNEYRVLPTYRSFREVSKLDYNLTTALLTVDQHHFLNENDAIVVYYIRFNEHETFFVKSGVSIMDIAEFVAEEKGLKMVTGSSGKTSFGGYPKSRATVFSKELIATRRLRGGESIVPPINERLDLHKYLVPKGSALIIDLTGGG